MDSENQERIGKSREAASSVPFEPRTDVEGYTKEDCLRYCVEHPYLMTEKEMPTCASVCSG
jgi:hypothetical protein